MLFPPLAEVIIIHYHDILRLHVFSNLILNMRASLGKQFRSRLKLEQFDQGVLYTVGNSPNLRLKFGVITAEFLLSDHQKAKGQNAKKI